MTSDLAMMPAHQLVKLYKARKASPVEATKEALKRIEAFNPRLNAFQHIDPDGALKTARASEKRWAKGGKRLSELDGVPLTIKDMVQTKGLPTRMGSMATDADGLVDVLTHERDSLKSRLSAARARVEALLERLPENANTNL